MADEARCVCVTGGTGFLGSWCVKLALEQGFIVHVTVRSKEKAKFLEKLDGAAERMKIFEGCDLTKAGSFDEAIKGCKTVIHTASPFFLTEDEGEEKLVKPAVEGTTTVLDACVKFGVEKVVLTSSTAAIYVNYGTKGADHVFSEEDWSDEDLLREKKNFYSLSKVLAEKVAWDYVKKDDCPFKLAVMNPCLILGPQLEGQPTLNTSSSIVLAFFGAPKIKQSCMHLVDVRDVALAHIHAAKMPMEWDGWQKRYMLVGESVMPKESVQALRESEVIPEDMKDKLPTELDEDLPPPVMGAPPPNVTKFDTSRSLLSESKGGLGLPKYISLKEMLETAVKTMLDNGFDSMEKYVLTK